MASWWSYTCPPELPECCSSSSPEQVLCSSPHAHLLVDLLVDASTAVLQFASLRLGERVTSLRQKGFRAAQHLTQPTTTAQVTGRQQQNQLSDHLRLRGVAVATILTVSRVHLIVHQWADQDTRWSLNSENSLRCLLQSRRTPYQPGLWL